MTELNEVLAEDVLTDIESGCTTTIIPLATTDCAGNSSNGQITIEELLKLVDTTPLGAINYFEGNGPIDGWHILDGSTINQADYPEYFACKGYVGTHVLPDMRDRMLLSSGTTFPLGSTGGSVTHTMTLAELVNHDHVANVSDPGHYHNLSFPAEQDVTDGSDNNSLAANSPTFFEPLQTEVSATGITVDVLPTGSTQPFNIMNPYSAPGSFYIKLKKGVASACQYDVQQLP